MGLGGGVPLRHPGGGTNFPLAKNRKPSNQLGGLKNERVFVLGKEEEARTSKSEKRTSW